MITPKYRSPHSIDWFFREKFTGKTHDLHGKIWLVSGEDVPFFVNPLTHSFQVIPEVLGPADQLRLIAELLQGICQHVEGQQDLSLRGGFEFAAFEVLEVSRPVLGLRVYYLLSI